jgi:hypothetical protein
MNKAQKIAHAALMERLRLGTEARIKREKELEKIQVVHEPWTKFDPATLRTPPTWMKNPVPCPQCQGHTVCIVRENAYGIGKHFRHACMNCGGMAPIGYVEADKACLHDFSIGRTVGNCLTSYTCSKCGEVQTIDSGD